MLHPAVLHEMLETEVQVAKERLGSSISFIEVTGADVRCVLRTPGKQDALLLFQGGDYDAEPFRVSVVRPDWTLLPGNEWPGAPILDHPVLHRPFICIQGTYEYHAHPSHFADTWDKYRSHLRLAELLLHLRRRISQQ